MSVGVCNDEISISCTRDVSDDAATDPKDVTVMIVSVEVSAVVSKVISDARVDNVAVNGTTVLGETLCDDVGVRTSVFTAVAVDVICVVVLSTPPELHGVVGDVCTVVCFVLEANDVEPEVGNDIVVPSDELMADVCVCNDNNDADVDDALMVIVDDRSTDVDVVL